MTADEGASDTVVGLDLGYVPEAAISAPFMVQDENNAVLTFNAMRTRPDGLRETAGTDIVEIKRCVITRFGYPNDEALPGHPLYQRGLGAYAIYEVLHSSWIAQVQAQNRVSFPGAEYWLSSDRYHHYAFTFHDSMFECIAGEIVLTVSREPWARIVQSLIPRFNY